ncbi:hypothetical protein LSTR_LSTR009490 [Laodelphax striatellus]|uniref:Odorant receptor n=1 Tax=Laodelphax striatellus TaxID=195883 RepID=A0A482WGF4_LAOST|nr:hypothetical protein LSTR_LSTR009490 [Laodelphax striatellus]
MEIIERVRSIAKFLGGSTISLRSRLFILLNLVIQADQLFSMYIDWNVFVKRLLAFKEFNSALFAIFVCLSLDDISSLCNMTEKRLNNDKISQKGGDGELNITSKFMKNMAGTCQKWDITTKPSNKMENSHKNSGMIAESSKNMLGSPRNLDATTKYTKNITHSLQKSTITSKFVTNMVETDHETDLTLKCIEDMKRIDKNLKRILMGLLCFASCLPITFACLITIFKDKNNINIDKMPFVIYMYYPEGYKTLKIYFASLFLQLVWYATMLSYVYCASTSFALASISLCTQMRLICQSLFEVGNSGMVVKNGTVVRTDSDDVIEISQLKQIIRDHQDVFNDFLELNRRSKIIVSAFINILAIQMCCYIFFIIELENLSAKIKYLATMFLVFSMMFYFSTVGQSLTDESGNVELALWECPWIDKSAEFRKCILMMMTRASRKVFLRPYNLYVVDFKWFTNIVNATYSYFNLISNSKSNVSLAREIFIY